MNVSLIISYIHNLYAVVKLKPEKRIQAWTAFEPMTSAIPVQSYNVHVLSHVGAGDIVNP